MSTTNNYYYLGQSGVLNSMLFLERFAFYGLQTFAFSYLISDAMNLYGDDANELLLTFASALLFARVFGGLIVDFLLGPKLSIIVSAVLQISGILLFMQKQLGMFYLGMFVFILGQSLFSPAILKSIGSVYSAKKNKIDGAVTLSLFAINLGSFLAPRAFHYFDLADTFESGFTSCIICFVVIIGLCFFIRYPKDQSEANQLNLEFGNRANELIFLSILGLFIYWLFEQLLDRSMSNFNYTGFRSDVNLFVNMIPSLIPLTGYLVFGILWNRFKFSPLLKIIIGFAMATLSILAAILMMANGRSDNSVFTISFISLNFIGEILVVPIFLSLIIQYAPKKLMATYSGVALALFGFLSMFMGNKIFDGIGEGNSHIVIIVAGIGFFFCTLIVLILFLLTRKKDVSNNHLDEF
ncbi:MAG: major facilitator superfamily 1 [Fluviicola sp.]|jgi:dipeptide/tripeptide permease|uniref:MFS transporter n=1 Tax=Fluviicola sp. TaxID=1917219 RepID=UPI0026378736|nr:MFS transporter [Fluviicola sp.]MDF3026841.1 major facilitator superfamily 1 [Fluviicola sp.]